MNAPRLPIVSALAGVSFHQDVVSQVSEGDRVLIEHDPANEYDANACKVTWHGETLGHLPKLVAARMVSGPDRAWLGQVVKVKPGQHATGLDVRLLKAVPASASESDVPDRPAEGDGGVTALVRTRSGRVLGTLVSADGTTVKVATDSGVADYPVDLVLLSAAG